MNKPVREMTEPELEKALKKLKRSRNKFGPDDGRDKKIQIFERELESRK